MPRSSGSPVSRSASGVRSVTCLVISGPWPSLPTVSPVCGVLQQQVGERLLLGAIGLVARRRRVGEVVGDLILAHHLGDHAGGGDVEPAFHAFWRVGAAGADLRRAGRHANLSADDGRRPGQPRPAAGPAARPVAHAGDVVVTARVLDARTLSLAGVRLAAQLPDGVVAGQVLRLRVAGGEHASGSTCGSSSTAAAAAGRRAGRARRRSRRRPTSWRCRAGAVARVHVEEREEAEGGAAAPGAARSVVVRYDSPTLGRLDIRLDASTAAVHVSDGDPAARVRAAADQLRDALAAGRRRAGPRHRPPTRADAGCPGLRSRAARAALRYDKSEAGAPKVVAAGAGLIADRIVEIAREQGVPVREDPALAEALARLELSRRSRPSSSSPSPRSSSGPMARAQALARPLKVSGQ